ncbi:hypothetical protein BJ170DRAFT_272240 [Xylariales sp. AK1849]|nr:hypothetical protein BJ170DRAFT_272240 [Xylariales sp. AK1849]
MSLIFFFPFLHHDPVKVRAVLFLLPKLCLPQPWLRIPVLIPSPIPTPVVFGPPPVVPGSGRSYFFLTYYGIHSLRFVASTTHCFDAVYHRRRRLPYPL